MSRRKHYEKWRVHLCSVTCCIGSGFAKHVSHMTKLEQDAVARQTRCATVWIGHATAQEKARLP
jgi:hypothetical protein